MQKPGSIIISIALILAGSLLFYFDGYKDSELMGIVSYLFVFIGWLALSLILFGKRLFEDKAIALKEDKMAWLKQKTRKAICYLIMCSFMVGNVIFVNHLEDERILTDLRSDRTKEAIAVVTRLEDRNSRGGAKHYAIIRYQTSTKDIEQALYNGYDPKYSVGQKILIKYSIDHPEMFEVMERPLE